jgi:transposase
MIKVYEYGLLRPTENLELVLDQMRLGARYYNKLVEIERERRDAVAKHLSKSEEVAHLEGIVVRLEARLERIRTHIKEQSSRERKRRDRQSTTKWTIAALKTVRSRLKPAKKIAREMMAEAITDAGTESNVKRRAARATCGVYWGTYLLQEQAIDAATKYPTPPQFHSYRGEGRVGVQLQGGMTVDEVFSEKDTQIRISPVSKAAYESPSRGERRRQSRTTLRLRVGSQNNREPIWTTFPMIMHRPFPDGTIIKNAIVKRRLVADLDKWTLLVTVDVPDPVAETQSGIVAVDVGWRKRDDNRLRVGYLASSDGTEKEIRAADESISERLRLSEDLRSIRDQMFDRCRALLVAWIKARPDGAPEWMRESTSHVHQWRSPGRMVRLLSQWQDKDDPILEWLTWWRHRDRHLWQYEAGTRRHALLHRRETYRKLASELAEQYEVLVLEKMDIRELAVLAPAEKTEDLPKKARAQRVTAAPSELRSALINAFRARGGRVVMIPAAYTTTDCAQCQHRNTWKDQTALHLTCAGCGAIWDQDANAARNLLRAAQTQNGTPEALVEKKPGRAERLRAAKARLIDPVIDA